MRILRPFMWAAVMVAAFLYVTSVAHWNFGRAFRSSNIGRLWSEEPASAAGNYTPDEQNNIDVYRGARDATVNITSVVYRETWFSEIYPEQGAGSGFIVSPDGEILTNNHVVNGGSAQLTVTLANKKSYKAKILFADSRDDLALIKIDSDSKKLPALRLGDSDATVVGQKVLAIGNPFGFGGTLTTGIVSSLGRTIKTEESRELEGMIQTDAAINPGNSGGPLLDSRGAVIGINTAIYGAQGNIGLGFAIPINRAKSILDEFQAKGYISRPTLGIDVSPVAGDLAELLGLPSSGGLLVRRVETGSSAEAAGLRGPSRWVVRYNYRVPVGADLITALDGETVEGTDSLQRVLNHKHGGDKLEMTIYRDGHTQKISVKLGEAKQM